MAFAGIKSDKHRADVIAFLRSLSKSPVPLPAARHRRCDSSDPAAPNPAPPAPAQ